MLTLSEKEFQLFLYRHAGPQSQPYERYAFAKKLPPIFNVIVKAENSEKSLQQIANMTGTRYSIRDHASLIIIVKEIMQFNFLLGISPGLI